MPLCSNGWVSWATSSEQGRGLLKKKREGGLLGRWAHSQRRPLASKGRLGFAPLGAEVLSVLAVHLLAAAGVRGCVYHCRLQTADCSGPRVAQQHSK